jgi:hypothetical protein
MESYVIITFGKTRGIMMSPAMMKMWVSIAGMGLMFLAILTIYLSRFKFTGVLRIVTAIIAYILMIVSGIIIFIVLFTKQVDHYIN